MSKTADCRKTLCRRFCADCHPVLRLGPGVAVQRSVAASFPEGAGPDRGRSQPDPVRFLYRLFLRAAAGRHGHSPPAATRRPSSSAWRSTPSAPSCLCRRRICASMASSWRRFTSSPLARASWKPAPIPISPSWASPQTASPRLNFAQAFNGVATVLGPLVGGYVIFSGVEYTPAQMAAMGPAAVDHWRAQEAAAVGPPYLVLGILMVVIASAIALTRYPALRSESRRKPRARPLPVLAGPRVALCRDRAVLLCRRPGRHLEPAGGFRA